MVAKKIATVEEEKKSLLTERQKKLLDRIKNQAHLIGHLVGFRDLTELHAKWINNFWKARHQVYVLQSHRNSYKTSCIALFIALVILLRPHENIFYVRKTETLVKDIVAKVSKILQSDVFQGLASILYGYNYRLIKNTATEIDTSLPHGNSKDVQFIGFGIDGKMTGRHCDWLIGDDLCFVRGTKIATPFGDRNIEDLRVGNYVLTTNGYQKIIRTSKRQAEVICNVGLCGTPNHPVYSKILDDYKTLKTIKEHEIVKINNYRYECPNLTGIQTVYNIEVENTHNYYANGILVHNCDINDRNSVVTREHTKDVWRELYANILKPTGRAIVLGTPWSETDVFSIMPKPDKYDCYTTGLLTGEQLEEKKRQTTPALFAANYELKFIADEDAIFTNYQVLYDKDIGCNLTGADIIKGGVCHVDAGFFGGDTTAFTILKRTSDGRYIVFGKVWSKHVQACLGEIIKLKEKYEAGSLYLETNADKGYLAKEFREQGVRCLTYHEKRNKYEKVTSVLLPIWDKLYFIEDSDLNYINQIMSFSQYCEHDDCADSLASLVFRSENFKAKAIEGINI